MRAMTIGENEAGQRMDKYLKKYFRGAESGFLYKMLRKKNIVLNNKKAQGSEILKIGDVVTLYLAEETVKKFQGAQPEKPDVLWPRPKVPLDILYEDHHIMILNKPAGMLSQKASSGDVSMVEYLIGMLLERREITEEQLRTFHPSVCNRLDRNTSGIILAGKTLAGLQYLSGLMKERSIKKYYLCLVWGRIAEPMYFRAWHKKNSKTNQAMIFTSPQSGADLVETACEPLWNDEEATLLKVALITGKSHQIRSQFASIGHPLAGDPKYGQKGWNRLLRERDGLNRQFLHAWKLVFPKQTGVGEGVSGRTVTAPLPTDLKNVLRNRRYVLQ